jgi:hypothetical protein
VKIRPRLADELTDELDAIDRRAFEMARSVLADPAMRTDLAEEADRLSNRLVEVKRQLEQEDPKVCEERRSQISEATLDLTYARYAVPLMSLRLGQIKRTVDGG